VPRAIAKISRSRPVVGEFLFIPGSTPDSGVVTGAPPGNRLGIDLVKFDPVGGSPTSTREGACAPQQKKSAQRVNPARATSWHSIHNLAGRFSSPHRPSFLQ